MPFLRAANDLEDIDIEACVCGGDLNIEWRESDNNVYMTGPATEVFSGEWNDHQ